MRALAGLLAVVLLAGCDTTRAPADAPSIPPLPTGVQCDPPCDG